jgi:hypothetical protein
MVHMWYAGKGIQSHVINKAVFHFHIFSNAMEKNVPN